MIWFDGYPYPDGHDEHTPKGLDYRLVVQRQISSRDILDDVWSESNDETGVPSTKLIQVRHSRFSIPSGSKIGHNSSVDV